MRILFISHVPAVRELGAGRVQLELGEELVRQGHEVDFFTPSELGPRRALRAGALTWPGFGFDAERHVRQVAKRYDVIEGHQGLITRAKGRIGFAGVLAVRSSGLISFYRRADRELVRRLPREVRGRPVGRVLRGIEWHRAERAARRSFEVADVVHVPNEDERLELAHNGLGEKVFVIPNALTQAELDRLAAVAHGPRPATPEVLVIASWTHRKGVADWPRIMAATWNSTPSVRFHFAGTGAEETRVRRDLGTADPVRVRVTPRFDADQLAGLLAASTVGALPSYVEGFGLSALETLAAGRPCVVYDIPGPRGLAGAVDPRWVVPTGQPEAFGDRVAETVRREQANPGASAGACLRFASSFSWREVARRTAELYERSASGSRRRAGV